MEANEIQDRFDGCKTYDPKFNFKSKEERLEIQENYEKVHLAQDFFHDWECVSIHINNATVDFVIKDREKLFALLHVLNHTINNYKEDKTPGDCLRAFINQRNRMLLAFNA